MLLTGRILYEDGEAIVIDKPAGLPVDQPRDGALSVQSHLDSLKLGFHRRPTTVHRLDRDTSGCLLLARNPKAHARLGAAFEGGEAAKTYLAVLAGVPDEAAGTLHLPLAKVSTREDGWRMVVDHRRGKPATTAWAVLGVRDGRALVRFTPSTGRTHQLRVHAASGLGHAILGDPVYGDGRLQMLLHAWTLSVPRDGKPPIAATAPPPPAFAGYGDALG